MLLPISWLKKYLPILPPTSKLVEELMMHGLEVEKIIDGQSLFNQVVVGEILTIRPHPNADKLQLVNVNIGQPGEAGSGSAGEIVCGALNIDVGQKVALALVGAKLPNGLTIEPRQIRGIISHGMICSEDELGLGKSHAGILVLDPKLKVGTPFTQAVNLDDVVLDLALPANRADLSAVRGLAWEIGAILGKKVKLPSTKLPPGKIPDHPSVSVTISSPILCPLYTARVIRGVKIQPSPAWLQQRLRAAGMRPINAVVDATNYVMLDYGQPLHAFDAAKVKDGTIDVRAGRTGERLVTLDGQTRQLDPSILVIADSAGPLAIAGVMGGQSSEVSDTTTDIILESAIFDSVSIRKTSRRLNLISEASKRFERGLWPSLPEQASEAAATMIVELCGGTVEQGSVRVGKVLPQNTMMSLNPGYISERLGKTVSLVKSKGVLTKLGFRVQGTAQSWNVTIPDWRRDVSIPEDLVDEVGRLVGYEKLPQKMPSGRPVKNDIPPAIRFRAEVRNILVDLGFTEVISHAFYGLFNANIVSGRHFEIANSLDATQQKLRKSLLPQLDDILKRQADAGNDAVIFEIGLVFDPDLPGLVERQQKWKLALGVTHKGGEQLKTTIRTFQQHLVTTIQPDSSMVVEKLVRGRMIEFCEFDLSALMASSKVEFGPWDPERHISHTVQVRELSKYPAITRDIAFWWSGDESAIDTMIKQLNPQLLKEHKPKDKFVKDGKMSYTYTFIFQSPDRTLTKTEVDTIEQKIKDALRAQGATIR